MQCGGDKSSKGLYLSSGVMLARIFFLFCSFQFFLDFLFNFYEFTLPSPGSRNGISKNYAIHL